MSYTMTSRPEREMILKLRNVTLRGFPQVRPYRNAAISIEALHPNILSPAQRYCLIPELKKIQDLRWRFLNDYGEDILRLNGYLKVIYHEQDAAGQSPAPGPIIDILPPVIEEYIDPRGEIRHIICDGQHRSFLARQMNLTLNVVFIRNVPKDFYYDAYPLPGGWDDVELMSHI